MFKQTFFLVDLLLLITALCHAQQTVADSIRAKYMQDSIAAEQKLKDLGIEKMATDSDFGRYDSVLGIVPAKPLTDSNIIKKRIEALIASKKKAEETYRNELFNKTLVAVLLILAIVIIAILGKKNVRIQGK